MKPLTAETITDEQIREHLTDDLILDYGYQANANGDHVAVKRAHTALAVPPVSWDCAWKERDQARFYVAWHIGLPRANSRADEGRS